MATELSHSGPPNPVRSLDPSICAVLISGHMDVLPESVLAWLGPRVLKRFYDFVVGSEQDALFVRFTSAGGFGAAVASTSTQDLNARFIATCPLTFAAASMRAFAADQRMRRLVRLKLSGGRDITPSGLPAAELVHIYVAGHQQSRGLGKSLMSDVSAWFRARGHSTYFVKTAAAPANRAIGFYERLGFREVGKGCFKGLPYVWFISPAEGSH
jgi:GNAT superfamily N-acetyltransferase